MATNKFNHIGLIGRPDSELANTTLRQLVGFLQKRGCNVVLENKTAKMISNMSLQKSSEKLLGENVDLVIVVGGDGCLLGAARALAKSGTPVLGVNRGSLGFLTDVLPRELEQKVGAILDGDYNEDLRFLLDAEIKRDKVIIGEFSALNDVVFQAPAVHMLEFELYIDGIFVYSQRSDGLIISTPTGSTAYALSGGGPIMHPKIDALVIVPINPHTLTGRPIVIDGNSEIKIINSSGKVEAVVSCDGQAGCNILSGDVINIRKKPHKLNLLHPIDHDFYQSCRSKLGWGSKL